MPTTQSINIVVKKKRRKKKSKRSEKTSKKSFNKCSKHQLQQTSRKTTSPQRNSHTPSQKNRLSIYVSARTRLSYNERLHLRDAAARSPLQLARACIHIIIAGWKLCERARLPAALRRHSFVVHPYLYLPRRVGEKKVTAACTRTSSARALTLQLSAFTRVRTHYTGGAGVGKICGEAKRGTRDFSISPYAAVALVNNIPPLLPPRGGNLSVIRGEKSRAARPANLSGDLSGCCIHG